MVSALAAGAEAASVAEAAAAAEEGPVAVSVTTCVDVERIMVVNSERVIVVGAVGLGSAVDAIAVDRKAVVLSAFEEGLAVTKTMLGVNLPVVVTGVVVVNVATVDVGEADVTDVVAGCAPGVVPFSSPGRNIVCSGA